MHIGIIYILSSKSPDYLGPRLMKEVNAMGAAGMRISILCPRVNDDQPEVEQLNPAVTVYRKTVPEQPKIASGLQSRALFFPAWKPVIDKFITDHGIDVLHVRDLPMLPTTLSVAKRRSIPVVADFYENWPAAIESYRGDQSWLCQTKEAIYRMQFLLRWYERRSVQNCERVVVVVPESIDRFLKAGFPQEKFVVVSNTEDETTLQIPEIDLESDEYELFRNRWVAIYHGNIGPHRGVDTAIRGVKEIARRIPNFLLLILGASSKWVDKLQKTASALGVERHVAIHGWTPYETCIRYVLASQAGLVPHNAFEHTNTTVPHKLFQYMICERPVVVSDCPPLKRIVSQADAGAVFKANDPHDFAKAIIRLAQDQALCDRYGANGKRAALGEFSWKHDAARLVAMYEEIGRKYSW